MSYFQDGLDGAPEPVLKENLREYRAGVRAREANEDLVERQERQRLENEVDEYIRENCSPEQRAKLREERSIGEGSYDEFRRRQNDEEVSRGNKRVLSAFLAFVFGAILSGFATKEYASCQPDSSCGDRTFFYILAAVVVTKVLHFLFKQEE